MTTMKIFMKKNMKVLTALGLVIALVLSSTFAIAFADSSTPSGSGTSADPYIITTAAQLADIPTLGMSAYYKLGNDIDLSSYGNWTPIGTSSSSPFTGVFDGNNHLISGLSMTSATANKNAYGLFGCIQGATIINVSVNGSISLAGYQDVGLLVGSCYQASTINNCNSSGTVTGKENIGGLVGYLWENPSGTALTNCTSSATVTASSYYGGGLAGNVTTGNIINCSASGTVNGSYLGGLVGTTSGNITNSYATGSVTGSGDLGGLVGDADGLIYNSYSTGNVKETSATGVYVGGFLGYISYYSDSSNVKHYAQVINCYELGNVTGLNSNSIGGFAAYGATSNKVANCYEAGSVTLTSGSATIAAFTPKGFGSAIPATSDCYYNGTSNSSLTDPYAAKETTTSMEAQLFADTLNSNITSLALTGTVSWNYSSELNGGYPYLEGVGVGIDTTPPSGTFSLSPSDSTPGPVTITLTATDDMSGVASITLPDGSTVTTATATYQVSANGGYDFTVKDNAGNSAVLTETVSNISETSTTPNLSIAATYALSSDSTNATVTADVTDDSGTTISAMAYASGTQTASYFASAGTAITPSAGSGSGVIGVGTFAVSSNGDYTVYVKDSSGNEAVQTVTVSGIVGSGSSSSSSSSSSGTGTASNLSIAAIYALSSDSTSATVTATVTDDSGTTISAMAYASGTQTASYFASAGTAITPSAGSGSGVIGIGTFSVSSNGDYTIYVKDSNGNEAVQTVTVSGIGSDSSSSSSDPGSSSSGSSSSSSSGSTSQTDTVGVSGTISASGISVTHPTSINYTIDANGNFLSPDFPITNNSAGPVKVTVESLKSIAGGSLQFTDVDPLSEDWSNLDLAGSLKYIALGIGADTSTGWTSGESTNTFWSVNTTPLAIGDIASAGSASLKLTAYNGKVFDKSYTAEHSLVLEFDLD